MIHETDGSKRINYNEFVSEFIKKIKQAIWLKYTLNQKNIKSIKKQHDSM
jgi:DNA/RNA endonuclease G (NUC1)